MSKREVILNPEVILSDIVSASDLLQECVGLRPFTLARIIDASICYRNWHRSIDKKYRRYPSQDFGYPTAYYFCEKLDDTFSCKEIKIPSPYSVIPPKISSNFE